MLSEAIDVIWCERRKHRIDVHLVVNGAPHFAVFENGVFAESLTREQTKTRISDLGHQMFKWELAGRDDRMPGQRRLQDALQRAIARHKLPLSSRR
jgi:hypothetical protein